MVWSSTNGSRHIERLGTLGSDAEEEVLKAGDRQKSLAGQRELDLRIEL